MFSTNVNILIVVGLLAIVFFEYSVAIKCWDCNSFSDKNCGEHFDNSTNFLMDCSKVADEYHQKCRKIRQKIVGGKIKFTRSCLVDDQSWQLNDATIDLCSADGCNSGLSYSPFVSMIFAAPIFIGIGSLVLHST